MDGPPGRGRRPLATGSHLALPTGYCTEHLAPLLRMNDPQPPLVTMVVVTRNQSEPEDDPLDVSASNDAESSGQAQQLLRDLLGRDEHAAFVRSLDNDPDLATT